MGRGDSHRRSDTSKAEVPLRTVWMREEIDAFTLVPSSFCSVTQTTYYRSQVDVKAVHLCQLGILGFVIATPGIRRTDKQTYSLTDRGGWVPSAPHI